MNMVSCVYVVLNRDRSRFPKTLLFLANFDEGIHFKGAVVLAQRFFPRLSPLVPNSHGSAATRVNNYPGSFSYPG